MQLGGTPYKNRTMWKANGQQLENMATIPFGANESDGKLVCVLAVAVVGDNSSL